MAVTYTPAAHTAPVTATVAQSGNTQNIQGTAPGPVCTQMSDSWVAATVWLPTTLTADGFPDAMRPFSTSGSVTVT